MTQQQETRFACDRCHHAINVPMNEQPAMERGKPPSGWATFWIGSPTAPASHLCPDCNVLFGLFMEVKP